MFVPLASPDITEKEIETVNKVLQSGMLSIGEYTKKFEEKIAKYSGLSYAVAVNSGTSALHLIARALNMTSGDIMITSSFTFISSANVALFEHALPVFADIDEKTLNITPETLDHALKVYEKRGMKTEKLSLPVFTPGYFMAVDIFGHPLDWNGITNICENHKIKIIEDSCEALGSEYKGNKVGSFGEAGSFAFYPNKQITTGEGGIIVTDNETIAKNTKSMRNQGRGVEENWLEHVRLGYNYRIDELSAAIGSVQMDRFDELFNRRSEVANRYNSLFENVEGVQTPYIADYVTKMSWFVYVIRFDETLDRDKIMEYLNNHGVQCRDYFKPIHLQPFYKKQFGYTEGMFPVTEKVSKQTLAIPFHNNLTVVEQNYVAETLKEAIERVG
ncbi:MAG: DegT/DnrJ/EryC1/StrS family aminotransferase [Thermotogota bacterium]|nr:DegT/DnrJ/EryC1/StrS family aminotransferase [Thermotogota bacterium]